ncbi:tRNA intron endonuclease catalytic C-inal domain containing protein [Leishmania donovani]|uniref:tRNA_intron_endonuclease_-_catalytic_C-terminal_domain_containing_protein_-_putative n=3 Tax=Leishmania donovani species complex TaxID=38574 RepID=A0A6L0XSJ6_LEIIN|nr:conserved hypothetical protein [Leishmania infantum JPCM5]XP_003865506.1 hypothetical protein, conserved [Leishmania donovani]CAC9551409.1 tRNA_intron_endonuclease_-_catalytic_C-terminal_domain_containing_protein_-_putative [Leishmania infantum]AYU83747.1 tRNA intron endonuclease, catalytic C-terminal domain containing protein, putative [Leishmania donovani]TPP42066.1 tRNA intron endonuclease, catalytic C-terminal domain family protein [Leishmania donovani]TPP48498.1 tRNA intron endonucleas|eukprot:XP_001469642.1 conserved hypothetical protein [Leishmania infantum JPCM5]
MLVIEGTNGPLFRVAESAAAIAYLSTHYPQCKKRGSGWHLSVEEVSLLQSQLRRADGVHFASADTKEQFEVLRKRYARDCAVYAALTTDHGYRLRHGSQFGANYIGYQDVGTHGECLLFTGPLAELERVRAVRIARSVGKRAMLVTVQEGDSGCSSTVTVTDLMADSLADLRRPHKSCRKA